MEIYRKTCSSKNKNKKNSYYEKFRSTDILKRNKDKLFFINQAKQTTHDRIKKSTI